MKRLIILFAIVAINSSIVFGQCAGRFTSEIFNQVDITTVTYSSVYNLEMDIYQPVGDSFAKRPVILFGHGGTYIGGNKNNGMMEDICNAFAKRGYVTASFNYRLASGLPALFDSLNALEVALKTVGDARAAIRYLRKDAATDNLYRIDPNQIWIGGNSAGAITALHVGYVTDTSELPGYLKTIVANNGGINGDSGNPGYSSEVSGVINLAGGINKLEWIEPNDIPVVSCHGNADATVPYNCDDVLQSSGGNFFDLVDLCGSGPITDHCDAVGTDDTLLTFPGDGHVPWQGNASKKQMVFDIVTDFLAKYVVCDSAVISTGVSYSQLAKNISIYPNPAKDVLTVKSGDLNDDVHVEVVDLYGKSVFQKQIKEKQVNISLKELLPGNYIVRLMSGKELLTKRIVKL